MSIFTIGHIWKGGCMSLTIAQREQLAKFAGLECRCENIQPGITSQQDEHGTYWGSCPMHSNGGQPPDYDRDEVAVGLLPVLVSKDYPGALIVNELSPRFPNTYSYEICRHRKENIFGAGRAIASAICAAVLALIEEEK